MGAAVVLVLVGFMGAVVGAEMARVPDLASLPVVEGEPIKMENALWGETPEERQLLGRKVVIADIKGPAVITMIHFAMPQDLDLDRGNILRIWWDHEKEPSVLVPLVDFFCDPDGTQERVDSLLVNKRRGWNAYFSMPFAKRALIEMEHDGRGPAPCYSYVMYRPLKRWNKELSYFHAYWRHEKLLLGQRDYVALETKGRGKFIGWNVTVRGLPPNDAGYPVDENAKFYVDGELNPSVELMGLEDAFGFSWGFPETANFFPFTGWAPYYKGAYAYRFFIHDAVTFRESLRVTIGFGEREAAWFRETYRRPEYPLEFSSCCYWYQTEPHAPFPTLASYRARRPSPDAEQLRALEVRADQARQAGLALQSFLGDPEREDSYMAEGYDCILERGYRFFDTTGLWDGAPLNHCWASWDRLDLRLVMPVGVAGKLRLFILDGDHFQGGRKQTVIVGDRTVGTFADFEKGEWVELNLTPADTSTGEVPIRIENAREGANVVVSVVEFQPEKPQ